MLLHKQDKNTMPAVLENPCSSNKQVRQEQKAMTRYPVSAAEGTTASPLGTNFSRRKAVQPRPPLPASTCMRAVSKQRTSTGTDFRGRSTSCISICGFQTCYLPFDSFSPKHHVIVKAAGSTHFSLVKTGSTRLTEHVPLRLLLCSSAFDIMYQQPNE